MDNLNQKLIELLVSSMTQCMINEEINYLDDVENEELNELLNHFYEIGDFNEETNEMVKEYLGL